MGLSPFLIELIGTCLIVVAIGFSKKTMSSYEQSLKLFARY
ncbi:MAG: hypothetical protein ABS903_11970 [Solibacillus sp.]